MTRWYFRGPVAHQWLVGFGACYFDGRADAAVAYHVDADDLVLLARDSRPLA